MSISERYRGLVEETRGFLENLQSGCADELPKEVREVSKAVNSMAELEEGVGEIPRIQLESKLTPVLLKAHTHLDRARLLLEEKGKKDRSAVAWELEQTIYRLLNDL